MKLNFSEGEIEFEINGDKNRVLKLNPNDKNFLQRFDDFKNYVNSPEFKQENEMIDVNIKSVLVLEEKLREKLDKIFYKGACQVIFGNVSMLGMSADGFVITNFLNSFAGELNEIKQKNIKKYTEKYEK